MAPDTAAGFAAEEEQALAAVLDEILPPRPDGRLPGAGALGLAAAIGSAARQRPELRPLLAQGLGALAARVRARGAGGFAALARAERLALLGELGAEAPAFVPTLTFLAYAAYYQDPRVLEALGHEPRPPYPKGYEVPPTDLALLEPVRRRAPFYRVP